MVINCHHHPSTCHCRSKPWELDEILLGSAHWLPPGCSVPWVWRWTLITNSWVLCLQPPGPAHLVVRFQCVRDLERMLGEKQVHDNGWWHVGFTKQTGCAACPEVLVSRTGLAGHWGELEAESQQLRREKLSEGLCSGRFTGPEGVYICAEFWAFRDCFMLWPSGFCHKDGQIKATRWY